MIAVAENITVSPALFGYDIRFDFVCPRCGQRHEQVEFGVLHPEWMTLPLLPVPCGESLRVRMPWHKTLNMQEGAVE